MEKLAVMEEEYHRVEQLLSENSEPLLNEYHMDSTTIQRMAEIESKLQVRKHFMAQKHVIFKEKLFPGLGFDLWIAFFPCKYTTTAPDSCFRAG